MMSGVAMIANYFQCVTLEILIALICKEEQSTLAVDDKTFVFCTNTGMAWA